MSGVDFRYVVPFSGIKPSLNFQDSLIGVDRPLYIGDNWYCVITGDSAETGTDLGSSLNIGGTGLTFGSGAGNFNNLFCQMWPVLISAAQLRAKSLTNGSYVQWKFIGRVAGVDCGASIFVMGNPGSPSGYALNFNSVDGGAANLVRNQGTWAAATLLTAGVVNYAPNDVIRLECRCSAPSNELKTFKNGVLQNTTIDSSAGRLVAGGMCGMILLGVFNGQMTFSNYDGGSL